MYFERRGICFPLVLPTGLSVTTGTQPTAARQPKLHLPRDGMVVDRSWAYFLQLVSGCRREL